MTYVVERFELNKSTKDKLWSMTPQFGYDGFGELVFYRTYSRFIDNNQEDWSDCVIRVTEGTFSIRKDWYIKNHIHWNEQYWQDYAERFAISMFKMEWLPPGRGLWAMGSDHVYNRGSMALYNCSFTEINNRTMDKDLGWLMDCLMLGVGVGFSPIRDDNLKLFNPDNGMAYYTYNIPDTREGWVESVELLIQSYLQNLPYIKFIYDDIRPEGVPISTFGGLASGPEPLMELHDRIRYFCQKYLKWKKIPNDPTFYSSTMLKMDIANAIGCCVVSGNVRRSAEIACLSITDPQFKELKDYEKYPYRKDWGWMSNNSVMLEDDDDFLHLSEIAKLVVIRGEPGYLNLRNFPKGRLNSKKARKDKGRGVNPCGEIILENKEVCNIAETCPTKCDSVVSWNLACEYATFYCSTVTLLPTHQSETNAVIARNRRIGVGIIDFIKWKNEIGVNKVIRSLRDGYKFIRRINKRLAKEAGIPKSIRVTTMKPGGCRIFSSLTTTTKGIFTLEELFINHKKEEITCPYDGFEKIIQENGNTNKILHTYDNGEKEIYLIKMNYGMELECTGNHPWFVKSFNSERNNIEINDWIETEKLKPGHILEVKPGIYNKLEHSKLKHLNFSQVKMGKCEKIIKEPDYMNPDLAWLFGFLWGNGSMSPKSSRLRFISQYEYTLIKVQKILKEQFELYTIIHPASENKDAHILDIGSVSLWKWCEENKIWKYNETGIANIPKIIRSSSYEDIIAFIAGVNDSDGCVSKIKTKNGYENRLTISTADIPFSKHLQEVALTVGISLGRSENSKSKERKGKRSIWLMTNTSYSIEEKFNLLKKHSIKILMQSDPYAQWIHERDNKKTNVLGQIKSITTIGKKPTFDIHVENDPWFYVGAVKSHNTIPKLPGLTSGMMHNNFRYMIRRIRIQQFSPIHRLLVEANIPYEKDIVSTNTDVFEFPIDCGYGKTAEEVSLWEQAFNLVLLQREWSDNAVSNTLNFKPKWELIGHYFDNNESHLRGIIPNNEIKDFLETGVEWYNSGQPKHKVIYDGENGLLIYKYNENHEEDDIEPVLSMIAPLIKSVSLLPHTAKGVYKQMPEEGISKEEYDSRRSKIKNIDWSKLEDSHGEDEKYCSGASCVIT